MPSQSVLTHSSYKPATGGHAPGDIRDAFLEAAEAFGAWKAGEPEPTVDVREQPMTLSRICGLVWNCSDIMPGSEARALADVLPLDEARRTTRIETYAQGARAMKAAIVQD